MSGPAGAVAPWGHSEWAHRLLGWCAQDPGRDPVQEVVAWREFAVTSVSHFLRDSCQMLLRHCGQPMTCTQTRTTWEGKPGQGAEISTSFYTCVACSGQVSVTTLEPC